jgi:hypothetical protein
MLNGFRIFHNRFAGGGDIGVGQASRLSLTFDLHFQMRLPVEPKRRRSICNLFDDCRQTLKTAGLLRPPGDGVK